MKNIVIAVAAFMCIGPASAQDTSGHDFFFKEELEGVYGNNWFLKHIREDGAYHHFSVVADGKIPYEGVFITACRTDMEDQIINGKDGGGYEYNTPSDEVINAFFYWVCTS